VRSPVFAWHGHSPVGIAVPVSVNGLYATPTNNNKQTPNNNISL